MRSTSPRRLSHSSSRSWKTNWDNASSSATAAACEHATQVALVAAGLGAAIIPRLGRDVLPPGVRIVRVKPSLTRHVYALWRTDASRRPGIRATVEAFQASARNGVSASD